MTLSDILALCPPEPGGRAPYHLSPLPGSDGASISEGARNDTLFKFACAMRRNGASAATMLAALQQHNHERCVPPLPDDELEKIAGSAERYSPADDGLSTPKYLGSAPQPEPEGPRWSHRKKADFRHLAPSWLIRGMIPKNSLGCIYGQSGVGKSLLALSMAKAITEGADWFGRECCERGGALWFALEGECDIYPREDALDRYHAFPNPRGITYVDQPFNLSSPTDTDEYLAFAESCFPEEWEGKPPLIVVIDTLACAMEGDENDTEPFRQAMRRAQSIKKRWHCAVVLIHHSVKADDEILRGNGHLKASLDWATCVKSSGEGSAQRLLVKSKKTRSFAGFPEFFARIATDELGQPCAVPADAPPKAISRGPYFALQVLHEQFPLGGARYGEVVKAVQTRAEEANLEDADISESTAKAWLKACVDKKWIEKASEQKSAPYRLSGLGRLVLSGSAAAIEASAQPAEVEAATADCTAEPPIVNGQPLYKNLSTNHPVE